MSPRKKAKRKERKKKSQRAPQKAKRAKKEPTTKKMTFLGFDIPEAIKACDIAEILNWGCENWHLEQLPTQIEITA